MTGVILAGLLASRWIWPDWWKQFEPPPPRQAADQSRILTDPCREVAGCVPVYLVTPERETTQPRGTSQ